MQDLARPKVLIVEDDQSTRFLVSAQLEMIGYDADVAANAPQALEKFSEKKYSIILMDIKMVGDDGIETTKQMRLIERDHRSKPTPIIAVTGRVGIKDRERCLNIGMDDVLTKPYTIGDLTTLISKHAAMRSFN